MEKHERRGYRLVMVMVVTLVAIVAMWIASLGIFVYGPALDDLDTRISTLETPVAEREK